MGSGAGFVLLAFPVLLASFEREREGGGGEERDEEIKERGEKINNQQGINCELSYTSNSCH